MKEGDHLGNLFIETMIILKWIIQKQCVRLWTGFNRLSLESKSGLSESSNELSTSVKEGTATNLEPDDSKPYHHTFSLHNPFWYYSPIYTSFPSRFHTKILREFLVCSTRAAYLILLVFIFSMICLRTKHFSSSSHFNITTTLGFTSCHMRLMSAHDHKRQDTGDNESNEP